MADLPSVIAKMLAEETTANQPVSQALVQKIGKNINGLIDRGGVWSFTSPGVTNWTVPTGITRLLLYGCGGGGGGAGASSSTSTGGSGGGGARAYYKIVETTPGDIIAITIGAGGAGGSFQLGTGGTGGDTSFGSLAVFRGSNGGYSYGNIGNTNIGLLDISGGLIFKAPGAGNYQTFIGGGTNNNYRGASVVSNFYLAQAQSVNNNAAGLSDASSLFAGGGAASDFGSGGNSGTPASPVGKSPPATAYGAGGGGGYPITGGAGGAGRSGVLFAYGF